MLPHDRRGRRNRTMERTERFDGGATDAEVMEWVRDRCDEFVTHVRARYPTDPRVAALLSKFKDVRALPAGEAEPVSPESSRRNGKFRHSTGVLYVTTRDAFGRPRTESSLLKTVVHELAHATRHKEPGEGSHSPAWKQTWLWFLEIATQELGWGVDIKCAECTFYGLCDRDQCPKCTWLQNLCRPYAGPPG